ncbi:unnamed protein product [Oikopleura dioica]|uniref:Uncharacterized protein n=1 Tax=Oikopleura dioica TaxID=34765 RepID=E4WSV9_OIKDI|nr:unnamed protein product [Oikopleura dioica]
MQQADTDDDSVYVIDVREDESEEQPEEIIKTEDSDFSFANQRHSGTSMSVLCSGASLLSYPEGLTIGTPSYQQNNDNKEFKKSTLSSDRTVVKQFGEYLATDPFHKLGIPTIPLEHDHGEFFVLDQVIDGLEIHQLDYLVADFFRKYKMGGVHGESEVKVTTLECRWSGLRRQLSLKGVQLTKHTAPMVYQAMAERRRYLFKKQSEDKKKSEEEVKLLPKSNISIKEDAIELVKFFVKYHTELPEVLSCLVHFIVINYLRIFTVSEIENLKFGDFIHHEDKHGEYFLPSKRLQKIYASNNSNGWIIPQASENAAFPCPVGVLKFYMSKLDPHLQTNKANLSIMALLLQTSKDPVRIEKGIWFATSYYKPKSALTNIFTRVQTISNLINDPVKLKGRYDNSSVSLICEQIFASAPSKHPVLQNLHHKFEIYRLASQTEKDKIFPLTETRIDSQFKSISEMNAIKPQTRESPKNALSFQSSSPAALITTLASQNLTAQTIVDSLPTLLPAIAPRPAISNSSISSNTNLNGKRIFPTDLPKISVHNLSDKFLDFHQKII